MDDDRKGIDMKESHGGEQEERMNFTMHLKRLTVLNFPNCHESETQIKEIFQITNENQYSCVASAAFTLELDSEAYKVRHGMGSAPIHHGLHGRFQLEADGEQGGRYMASIFRNQFHMKNLTSKELSV